MSKIAVCVYQINERFFVPAFIYDNGSVIGADSATEDLKQCIETSRKLATNNDIKFHEQIIKSKGSS